MASTIRSSAIACIASRRIQRVVDMSWTSLYPAYQTQVRTEKEASLKGCYLKLAVVVTENFKILWCFLKIDCQVLQ